MVVDGSSARLRFGVQNGVGIGIEVRVGGQPEYTAVRAVIKMAYSPVLDVTSEELATQIAGMSAAPVG